MLEPRICPGGQHLAPATGGSCACGMVTRIPAVKRPPAGPPPEVLAMLARSLDEWFESLEAAASGLLREHADRLMAALSTDGLVLPRIQAALLAAPAYTAPRAAAAREVVTPTLESARPSLSAGVDSAR